MQTGKFQSNIYNITRSTANSGSNPIYCQTSLCEITAGTTCANLVLYPANVTGGILFLYGNGGATLTTTGNIIVSSDFIFNYFDKHICLFWDGSHWREAYRTNLNGSDGPQGNTINGLQGSVGSQGPSGDSGVPDFTQGPQGYQGAAGTQGSPGSQGSAGDTGNTGPQGPQGSPGDPA